MDKAENEVMSYILSNFIYDDIAVLVDAGAVPGKIVKLKDNSHYLITWDRKADRVVSEKY